MIVRPFSVDPSGEWSPVQARRVLEIIRSEAETRGIRFNEIEVTTFAHPKGVHRVILVAHCIKHGCAVPLNSVCPVCLNPDAPGSVVLY